jgi:choline dehydrogenase
MYHGGEGPLKISDVGKKHELIEAFIAGAEQTGVPRNDDFNGATQEGAGYYQLTTDRGRRCSTARLSDAGTEPPEPLRRNGSSGDWTDL